jgi:hypothetical protein
LCGVIIAFLTGSLRFFLYPINGSMVLGGRRGSNGNYGGYTYLTGIPF